MLFLIIMFNSLFRKKKSQICNEKIKLLNNKTNQIVKKEFFNNKSKKKVDFNLNNNKIIYYDKEKSIEDNFRNEYINNINLFIPKLSKNDRLFNINDEKYIDNNINDIYNDITNNEYTIISRNLNYLSDNIDENQYLLNNKYNNFDNYSI